MKRPCLILKKFILLISGLFSFLPCFCWGFYAHKEINTYAVFLLPPDMLAFYKPNIAFLAEHAVDADMRRYIMKEEGPRHFIDLDHYGQYPFAALPHKWKDAVGKYGQDSIMAHGIVPWWIQTMQFRLTEAFKRKDAKAILRYSADLGHYIADAHVPLHTSSNHNGQFTNQHGIHGFWESRVPELLSKAEWDFFIAPASYITNTEDHIWRVVLESAAAVDTVLSVERMLTARFSPEKKYAYELRNNKTVRQYSTAFTRAYDRELKGMVERRMRNSIHTIASFWFTAWVNAGQPDLKGLSSRWTEEEMAEFESLKNLKGNDASIHDH